MGVQLDLTEALDATPVITAEQLYQKVSQEQIWRHLGVPAGEEGLFCSKLRRDRHDTCHLFKHGDSILYKDFATNDVYNCISYAAALYGCTYTGALRILANDFGLIQASITRNKPVLAYNGEKVEEKSTADIKVEIRPFLEEELEWWRSFGISKETLEYFQVFACKNVWLNENLYALDAKFHFGYFGGVENDIEYWKIYMPKKKDVGKPKFMGNYPADKIQGLNQLVPGDTLVIQKSLKDAMLMHEYGIPSIAPGSENTPIPDALLEKLKKIFHRIIIVMDNDGPGLAAEERMKEKHPELEYYHLPEAAAKDFSDLYLAWGDKGVRKILKQLKIS